MKLKCFISVFLLFFSQLLLSQEMIADSFTVNTDYHELGATDGTLPKLVLVNWYGSNSSYQVYGALNKHFEQPVLWPAVFREAWRPAARLQLMAQRLNLTAEQQLTLFQQVLTSPPEWTDKLVYQNMLSPLVTDPEQLDQVIHASELPMQLKNIQNKLAELPISTVPTIIFKGRYIIDATQAQTSARLIRILQFLDQQQPTES